MFVPHCQSFQHIWASGGANQYNFRGFVSEFLENPATFRSRIKKPLPANRRRKGRVGGRPTRGRRCGLPSGRKDQALLRWGVSEARRFAMNAARRLPRTHGMTVSFSAAAFVIDLMKRALVFMARVLGISFYRALPLVETEYDGAIGPVLGRCR